MAKAKRKTAPQSGLRPVASILECSAPERDQLLVDLHHLRCDRIRGFLKEQSIPRSGAKDILIGRIDEALSDGTLALTALIAFLDNETCWGKQHVVLFGPSPVVVPEAWTTQSSVRKHLARHHVSNLLNEKKLWVLPNKLQLSSIEHTATTVRVVAVQRREGWLREEALDDEKQDGDGNPIEMRAYRKLVTRGVVAFEWDLTTNVAMLQISQLPAHSDYKEVQQDFAQLVHTWLPIETFPSLSLSSAIASLYEAAKTSPRELRTHGVEFQAEDGRRLSGRSKRAQQRLEGHKIIDNALDSLNAADGRGEQGNFYFLFEDEEKQDVLSEDQSEVHVLLVAGEKNRINFTTPQTEEKIRHVLQVIRDAS